MKFKTQFNAEPSKGEVNTQPSQTIPDQSLSVKEIMRRYASGLPLEGQRVPLYEGEEEATPDFANMDLAEREQWQRDLRAELDETNQKIQSDREERQKAKDEAKKREKTASKIEDAEIIDEPKDKKGEAPK